MEAGWHSDIYTDRQELKHGGRVAFRHIHRQARTEAGEAGWQSDTYTDRQELKPAGRQADTDRKRGRLPASIQSIRRVHKH